MAWIAGFYWWRMPDLYVEGADSIDHIFVRVFSDLDDDIKRKLKKEYVTKEKIAEAPERIRKICYDLVDHYLEIIEPNGSWLSQWYHDGKII